MTTVQYILVVLVCMSLCEQTEEKRLNATHVLAQYVGVCGMKLCNKLHTSLPLHVPSKFSNSLICPDCSCDENCWKEGTCCPDVFLSLPYQPCQENVIVNSNDDTETEASFRMVDTCPLAWNSDLEVKRLCEGNSTVVDKITNVPVFSNLSKLTYRNKYCAKCHKQKEVDTTNWLLNFECKEFLDFNYFSNYTEIANAADAKKCDLAYTPHKLKHETLQCTSAVSPSFFHKCNRTGAWHSYDTDIENLCNYNGPNVDNIFADIFCLMCNPPKQRNYAVIQTCNETGFWDVYEQKIETACSIYPRMQISYPYKNYFCKLCNEPSTPGVKYADVSGHVSVSPISIDKLSGEYMYAYQFTDLNFNNAFISRMIKTPESFPISDTIKQIVSNGGVMEISGRHINITELLLQYYISLGRYDVCHEDLLKVPKVRIGPKCDCDPSCIFDKSKICCVDITLLYPTTCLDQANHSPIEGYNNYNWKVLNQCAYGKTFRQNSERETVLNILPVEDRDKRINYRNLYSAFCNTTNDNCSITGHVERLKPFDIHIVCKTPLNYAGFSFLYDVILEARRFNCTVMYQPKNTQTKCDSRRIDDIAELNELKSSCSSNANSEMTWTCEEQRVDSFKQYIDGGTYKNAFCYACKNSNPSPFLIGICNQTKQWKVFNQNVQNACTDLPIGTAVSPFKNVFCKMCNLPDFKSGNFSSLTHPKPGLVVLNSNTFMQSPPNIKDFFTPSPELYVEDPPKDPECGKGRIYDKWKGVCRSIKCYPGKFLDGEKCTPLFTATRNLMYGLSIRLEGYVTHVSISPKDIFDAIERDFLESALRLSRIANDAYFTSLSVVYDSRCDDPSKTFANGTKVGLLLDATFFVGKYVHRLEFEEMLVELTGNKVILHHAGLAVSMRIIEDISAHNVPLIMKRGGNHRRCFFTKRHETVTNILPYERYRVSPVSKLLLCKHVALTKDEVTIDNATMEMTIKNSEVKLHFSEFLILKTTIQICLDNLPEYSPPLAEENNLSHILSIVTLVCMLVSMICLVVPFVTYVLFPSLRSLPGLTTMGLILSLFILQFLFVLQVILNMSGVAQGGVCVAFGIILHFSWLNFFAWSNVCNFHLFRVFIFVELSNDDTGRMKDFVRYVIYTIVMPLAVVLLNLILTSAITLGESVGYDGSTCFISSVVGRVLAFIVPIVLICIVNFICFVVSLRVINQKVNKSPVVQAKNKQNVSHSRIYMKLFSLTGFTWLLQVVDGFLPITAFSFIVAIVNALQGVYIFVAYSCNTYTLNLYRNMKHKQLRRPRQKYSTVRKYASSVKTSMAFIHTAASIISQTTSSEMTSSAMSSTILDSSHDTFETDTSARDEHKVNDLEKSRSCESIPDEQENNGHETNGCCVDNLGLEKSRSCESLPDIEGDNEKEINNCYENQVCLTDIQLNSTACESSS